MRRWVLGSILWVAACNAKLADGGGDLGPQVDATTPEVDAPPVTVDAAPDAPACFNGRVVYLNFDGVTLTQGISDATQNRASWMTIATGTAPPWRAGSGTRQTDIDAVVAGVRAQLGSFPVTVVTQRPPSGPYVMIVFGGSALNVGSRYGLAVNELDCDDSEQSDVAWIGDASGISTQRIINTAIGAIGFGLGLTATTLPQDCMCGWANACASDNSQACVLSTDIARDPNAAQLCAGAPARQDEHATFDLAFCQ